MGIERMMRHPKLVRKVVLKSNCIVYDFNLNHLSGHMQSSIQASSIIHQPYMVMYVHTLAPYLQTVSMIFMYLSWNSYVSKFTIHSHCKWKRLRMLCRFFFALFNPPYVPGAASCRGGWPQWAMEYIISNGGVDTEASYPYVAHVSGRRVMTKSRE